MQPLDEEQRDKAIGEHPGAADQHSLGIGDGGPGAFRHDGDRQAGDGNGRRRREQSGKPLGVTRLTKECKLTTARPPTRALRAITQIDMLH